MPVVLASTEGPGLREEPAPFFRPPHAMSRRAALVKLADKTSNLRDVASSPPRGWPLERRRAYFDWAKAVVEQLPPVSKRLRAAFDEAYSKRP